MWGARHLLRMVYLLPTIVPRLVGATGPEAASYARAGGHLRHFVEWMADRREWLSEGGALGDPIAGDGDGDDDRVTTSSASGSRGRQTERSRSRTPMKRARGDSAGVPAAKQPTPPPPPAAGAAGGGIAAAAIAAAMAEANGGE